MTEQLLSDGPLFLAADPVAPAAERADDALAAVWHGRDWLARVMAEQRAIQETPPLPFGYILASGGLPPR